MSGNDARGVRVEVRELHRRFEKGGQTIEVLRGLSLELAPGEMVAVLGQSGSGKSTLLQVLGTLDRPSAGRVLFDGEDVFQRGATALDALRNRRIGFIFQFHHLLPDQTALKNVMIPARIGGVPVAEAERRARELLDRVGLGARLHHRPGELSGGEQQRVAIARALADEPTGNLDPATAAGVFEMLVELNASAGSTMVVVTHSLDLAARFPRRLRIQGGVLHEVAA